MAIVPFKLCEDMKRWKEEQIQKPRLPPNPNVSATASLQRDLSSVMANEDLSEAEKSQLYGQTLHKFKTAHQKALKETSLFSPSDPSSSKMNQLVIDSVPSTMKRKAQLLVSLLKNNPNVSWEDDGTVKLYGKSIPGSNIIYLVNDVIRHRKGSEPTGWQAFAEGLRDMNGTGCIVLQKLLKRIISLPNKNAPSEKQQVVFPFLSGLQRVWVLGNVSKTIFHPLHFYLPPKNV